MDEEEGNLEVEEENGPSSGTPCARSPHVNNDDDEENNQNISDKYYLRGTVNRRHTTYPT